jgi:hypothetical protein
MSYEKSLMRFAGGANRCYGKEIFEIDKKDMNRQTHIAVISSTMELESIIKN